MAVTNLASTSSTKTGCFLLVLALMLLLLILLSDRVHCRCLCNHRQSDNKTLEMCGLHISMDALGWVEVGWGDDMNLWVKLRKLFPRFVYNIYFEARWSGYYTRAVGAMIDHAIFGNIIGIVMTFGMWHQHVYYIEWKCLELRRGTSRTSVSLRLITNLAIRILHWFCTPLINLY